MLTNKSISTYAFLSLCLPACAECRPDLVAPGVARLTLMNLGVVTDALNADDHCGFESALVKSRALVSGTVGGRGSVVWSVDDCLLDLDRNPRTITDCNGVEVKGGGAVLVTATRTIEGTLTGDPNNPVIPGAADAVTVDMSSVRFENFYATRSGIDARMTMQSGELSARVQPRLAKSAQVDLCITPTANVEISRVIYRNAMVHIDAEGHSFDVDVPRSNFSAVIGRVGQEENLLTGQITVFEDNDIALPGEDQGVDPGYDAGAYEDTWTCAEGLATPISYQCGDGRAVMAMTIARLSIRSLGMITNVVAKDPHCGLTSIASLAGIQIAGTTGNSGEIQLRTDDCTIELPKGTVIFTDCTGHETKASGRVTVSAVQTIRGHMSSIPLVPPIPDTDDAITIDITSARFEDFEISDSQAAMVMVSGSISGRVEPRTARDHLVGLCIAQTGISRFSNLSYSPGSKIEIIAQGSSFTPTLDGAEITALSGTWNGDSNHLGGSLAFAGETYQLPVVSTDTGLDPGYDGEAFNETWMCGSVDLDAPFSCN